MAHSQRVNFFYDAKVTLSHRTELKRFISGLFKKEGQALESLNYIFCTDDRLLEINQTFLKHDYYTDIITFELATSGNATIGEIYISVDRVKENAIEHAMNLKYELHRVIFHGALHLCGYRDKSPSDQKTMRAKEDAYLSAYFA